MIQPVFSHLRRRRLQMGVVGRRIRWLLLPTSVCAAVTTMSSKVHEQELHARRAASVFLSSHVDRGTKP